MVLLSGFCDEISASKNVDEQFSVAAAVGLTHVTLRFVDVGSGVKNVLNLTQPEQEILVERLRHYGLQVASLGSPIGKVKLVDVDDGTTNAYRPQAEYLMDEVARAIRLCEVLGTRRIRGFSFYPPKGRAPQDFIEEAARRLRDIVERCADAGLVFGLEVEANLVGQNADCLLELVQRVAHPAMVVVFDGANLVTQGFETEQIVSQWHRLKPYLGWIHVKDYRRVHEAGGNWVDEERLDQFVPAGEGESGYREVFRDLRESIADVQTNLQQRGLAELVIDLEPHLKGGGQFGGFSGPDGFGVALRGLTKLLDEEKLGYRLRGFGDLIVGQSR